MSLPNKERIFCKIVTKIGGIYTVFEQKTIKDQKNSHNTQMPYGIKQDDRAFEKSEEIKK